MVCAPGRVNLIGEHTDYNDGFVLPMAIERFTAVAGAAKPDQPRARVYSSALDQTAEIVIAPNAPLPELPWARYVQGVVAGCTRSGLDPGPFVAAIDGDVPLGSGLSSSAALEVGVATLVEALCGKRLDPVAKARLCQEAERSYAGVPCGIMDQLTCVLARADHLLWIDCRSLETEPIPFLDPGVSILVIDSCVGRELAAGGYAVRREQCEAAREALGKASLREVDPADLEAARPELDPILHRRARHVVSENARTLATRDAIHDRDWQTAGELLYASHASLRDDFEVSCTELDTLVEIAREIGPQGGVFGARLTGGGFGGSTVWLVGSASVPTLTKVVATRYRERTGHETRILCTRPATGAHALY